MVTHFSFTELDLKGAYKITPFIASDSRGLFIKDYSEEIFLEHGIFHNLKEVFYTQSHKGVIRAIHFQRKKQQAKLVRCIHGEIFDIIVDLRKESPTFGKWQSFILSGDNHIQLYIPQYFGHGYLVMKPSIVSYQCAEKFYGEYDDGIIWNDPDIAIKWPLQSLDNKIILSEKDKNLQLFREFIEKGE